MMLTRVRCSQALLAVAGLLVVASVAMLLVAVATPLWLQTSHLRLGLWVACDRGGSCDTPEVYVAGVCPDVVTGNSTWTPAVFGSNPTSRLAALVLHSMAAFGNFAMLVAFATSWLVVRKPEPKSVLLHAAVTVATTLALTVAGFITARNGVQQLSCNGGSLVAGSHWGVAHSCSIAAVALQAAVLLLVLLLGCCLYPRQSKSEAQDENEGGHLGGNTSVEPLYVTLLCKPSEKQHSVIIQGSYQVALSEAGSKFDKPCSEHQPTAPMVYLLSGGGLGTATPAAHKPPLVPK